jgi:hypothetical protein
MVILGIGGVLITILVIVVVVALIVWVLRLLLPGRF